MDEGGLVGDKVKETKDSQVYVTASDIVRTEEVILGLRPRICDVRLANLEEKSNCIIPDR